MVAPRKISRFLFIAVFATATVSTAVAQPPGLPIQPDLTGRTFTIRVVNGSGMPIYYKLVGGPGKSFVHQTLAPGRSETERGVTGGEKALCVWRANQQVLLAVWVIPVDRNGKIVIPPPAPQAAAAPQPGEPPAAAPSPRLEVVPE